MERAQRAQRHALNTFTTTLRHFQVLDSVGVISVCPPRMETYCRPIKRNRMNRLSEHSSLPLAAQPRGPVADAADGVEGQAPRAGVLPALQVARLHLGARDELAAGEGVREVAAVQALDPAVAVDLHLGGGGHGVGLVVVVLVVDLAELRQLRQLGPRAA